jgi:hypothetical protein
LCAHRQIGLLDHVGGIDAALEPAVHAQPDHALEVAAMAFDQGGEGALVAVAGGVQEFLVGAGVGADGGAPIPLYGNAGRTFTARGRILFWPPRTSTSLPGGPRIRDRRKCGIARFGHLDLRA